VEAIAIGLSVLPVSAETGDGLDEMMAYLPTGTTAALVGSSGVGKSSIVNRLLGKQHLAVNAVREGDHRGRHSTSHRELLVIPGGGLIIDTPGMRELRMWGDDTGLQEVFGDVEELASTCRFGDCTHQHEPGCAAGGDYQDRAGPRQTAQLPLDETGVHPSGPQAQAQRRQNEQGGETPRHASLSSRHAQQVGDGARRGRALSDLEPLTTGPVGNSDEL
jgi:hypothetical protein